MDSETVNDPAAQVRFKHFINSAQRDPNVQVVSEREQHRLGDAVRTHSGNSGEENVMSQWVNICKIDAIVLQLRLRPAGQPAGGGVPPVRR